MKLDFIYFREYIYQFVGRIFKALLGYFLNDHSSNKHSLAETPLKHRIP